MVSIVSALTPSELSPPLASACPKRITSTSPLADLLVWPSSNSAHGWNASNTASFLSCLTSSACLPTPSRLDSQGDPGLGAECLGDPLQSLAIGLADLSDGLRVQINEVAAWRSDLARDGKESVITIGLGDGRQGVGPACQSVSDSEREHQDE